MTEQSPLSDRRSVFLMLLSVVLFSANTLLIRAVSDHVPAADGWVASLFRGVFGLAVVSVQELHAELAQNCMAPQLI